jgi:hypothetical protein
MTAFASGQLCATSVLGNCTVFGDRSERIGNSDAMLKIQLFGSMPMRSMTAARLRCITQVSLGRLDGNVPEKKLNLLQFATFSMAEPGTRPAKIV